MIEQVFAILKMKTTKLFLFVFICLNIISIVNVNTDVDVQADINERIEETIALKTRLESLEKVLNTTQNDLWSNFYKYCDWKIKYLGDIVKKIKANTYSEKQYYEDLLKITRVDVNCYANEKVGDKLKECNLSFDFDYTQLNEIYSRSNTRQHIHQQYVDTLMKYKILKQRVKGICLDENSILGHFISDLSSDSVISFAMPVVYITFTFVTLNEYRKNNLFQFYYQIYGSKSKMLFLVLACIALSVIVIYFAGFVSGAVLLLNNAQCTTLSTRVLIDKNHLFSMFSYPSNTEVLYYMGNKYYSVSSDFAAIPECLKLVEIWKVLLLTFILEVLKISFYMLLGCAVYLFKKMNRLKYIALVVWYCLSQFFLLKPIFNPFAIVSSYSVICGGYGSTWLSSNLVYVIYLCVLVLFIQKRMKKVDI